MTHSMALTTSLTPTSRSSAQASPGRCPRSPSGSAAAAWRCIERGRHPRFAIGESTTPLTNLLLEELADRYDLPRIRSFSKWGTWQRTRPDVACGLKRGFTFLFHQHGERFDDDGAHARQLLVAASPNDEIADTHWYRPDIRSARWSQEARGGGRDLPRRNASRAHPRRGPVE